MDDPRMQTMVLSSGWGGDKLQKWWWALYGSQQQLVQLPSQKRGNVWSGLVAFSCFSSQLADLSLLLDEIPREIFFGRCFFSPVGNCRESVFWGQNRSRWGLICKAAFGAFQVTWLQRSTFQSITRWSLPSWGAIVVILGVFRCFGSSHHSWLGCWVSGSVKLPEVSSTRLEIRYRFHWPSCNVCLEKLYTLLLLLLIVSCYKILI